MGSDGGTVGGTEPNTTDFPNDFEGCSIPVGVTRLGISSHPAPSEPSNSRGFVVSGSHDSWGHPSLFPPILFLVNF